MYVFTSGLSNSYERLKKILGSYELLACFLATSRTVYYRCATLRNTLLSLFQFVYFFVRLKEFYSIRSHIIEIFHSAILLGGFLRIEFMMYSLISKVFTVSLIVIFTTMVRIYLYLAIQKSFSVFFPIESLQAFENFDLFKWMNNYFFFNSRQ